MQAIGELHAFAQWLRQHHFMLEKHSVPPFGSGSEYVDFDRALQMYARDRGMPTEISRPLVYPAMPTTAMKFIGFVNEYVLCNGAIPLNFVSMVDETRRMELYVTADDIMADAVTTMFTADQLWVFGNHLSRGMQIECDAWVERYGFNNISFVSWQQCGVPEQWVKYYYAAMKPDGWVTPRQWRRRYRKEHGAGSD